MKNIQNVKKTINEINEFHGNINIMEVCGTHTMAICRNGIKSLINKNIKLISGPGCPVCVTPQMYIDYLCNLSLRKDVIIATYGDMIRVPGSNSSISLAKYRVKGARIKIVYSVMDALELARCNSDMKVIFAAVGFETTAPSTAVALKEALSSKVSNFYVLSMHKIIEPAMRMLIAEKELNIDSFLCPGHVAAVTGVRAFEFLTEYGCKGAVAGFEFEEIIKAIKSLVDLKIQGEVKIVNCYGRLVRHEGNEYAKSLIDETFHLCDDEWRGMGNINNSSLKLNELYSKFDIEKYFTVENNTGKIKNACRCGDIMKGKIRPFQCELFGKACTPFNPVGPCMVSTEGTCAAYFKYEQL